MKNSKLIFRSLATIIFITGIAHLASFAFQKDNLNYNYEEINKESIYSEYEDKKQKFHKTNTGNKKTKSGSENDYILGKWKVIYDNQNFKGSIVYNIKKEGQKFNAYIYQYQYKEGYTEKGEETKILIIKKIDGNKGKGIYTIEYEQQQYKVDCNINRLDENTFTLSYDYYGYKGTETWKRQ